MGDRYDEAIEYFQKRPDQIYEAWACPSLSMYGFLFRWLTPKGNNDEEDHLDCGCPTQIKDAFIHEVHPDWQYPIPKKVAWTDELTEAVHQDKDIPNLFSSLTNEARLASLPAFARIQRLADKLLNRSTDQWLPIVPPSSNTFEIPVS